MIIEPWDQERILLYGQEGSGKTNAVFSIIEAVTGGHFYYLDIDHTTIRFMNKRKGIEDRVSIDLYEDWTGTLDFMKKARVKATKDDWMVLDGAGETWLEAQGEYWRRSEQSSLSEAATQPVSDYGGAHGANWDRINKIYRDFSTSITRWPGHIIACTSADKLSDKDVNPVYNRYSDFGWRPSGQKYLGHHFHSVIFMQVLGSDRYRMTTVKDREREKMKMVEVKNFALDYLEGVAGWKS